MAYFLNLFRKASELGRLDNENARLVAALQKTEWKVTELEKEVRSERNKKDKILLRYADQVSRQNKLPEHFVSDAKPPEPPPIEVPSMLEDERYRHTAQKLREADLELVSGDEGRVEPFEVYYEAVKKDPEYVFVN